MNKKDKEDLFEQIAYDFEHTELSENALVEIGNVIIKTTVSEEDPVVLESMFHALFTLVDFHDIAKRLNMDVIIENLQKYDQQCTDYILGMLSYTGDMKYLDVIQQIHERFPNLQIEDDVKELKGRAAML
ncbi:MAG: hypothetical protein K2J80_01320 [Oscillospiraceae bacterium]|nr:hypothetical protein [Oscillospiraceae bacterium]